MHHLHSNSSQFINLKYYKQTICISKSSLLLLSPLLWLRLLRTPTGHLGLRSSLLSLGTLFLSSVAAIAAPVNSSAVGFIFIRSRAMMKTNYYRQCRPGTHRSFCFRRPRSFGNLYRLCWWSCWSWLQLDDSQPRMVGVFLDI